MSATLNQPYIFLEFLYSGMVIGLLYAAVFFIRSKTKCKAVRIILDIFYICCVFFITFKTFKDANNIALRAYPFLGIISGFLVYHFGPGKLLFGRKL